MRHTQASDVTDLMAALYSKDLVRIKEEIAKAKDARTLNKYITQSSHRCTNPMLYAAEHYTPALWPLIQARADVNVQDINGQTPLFKTDEPALMHMLIKAGANVNAQNNYNRTPLHCAKTLQTADMLIKAGAKLDNKDNYGRTPFLSLIESGIGSTTKDIANLMLRKKPDLIQTQDKNGSGPLHYAHIAEMAELLLNAGANPKKTNAQGETPLHWAVTGKKIAVINVLTPHSTLESYDSYGCTPLHRAIFWNDATEWAPAQALITAGAKVSAKVGKNERSRWDNLMHTNIEGNTPLHIAASTGSFCIARILLRHTRPPKPCAPEKTEESLA